MQKFKEKWITSLMKNLEGQVDEKTRAMLMLSCGRDCARRGAIKIANKYKGRVKEMVEALAKYPTVEASYKAENTVHLVYKRCLCELVAKGPSRLPDTYCICSVGWIMEMFETAGGKPVKVEILKTIKRGGASCEFIIRL
jgi:predicted hydrocarbon binding protein